MKSKTISLRHAVSTIVRVVGSFLLLCFVWQHAHWSVALCLTLCIIEIEARGVLLYAYGITAKNIEEQKQNRWPQPLKPVESSKDSPRGWPYPWSG